MDDLINRQAAIDAVLHHGEIGNNYTDLYHDGYCDGVYDSADILKDLPSAQPERGTGEWKPFDRTWGRSIYHCTACGEAEDCPTEMGKVIWRFCPNCGAKMGGDA